MPPQQQQIIPPQQQFYQQPQPGYAYNQPPPMNQVYSQNVMMQAVGAQVQGQF